MEIDPIDSSETRTPIPPTPVSTPVAISVALLRRSWASARSRTTTSSSPCNKRRRQDRSLSFYQAEIFARDRTGRADALKQERCRSAQRARSIAITRYKARRRSDVKGFPAHSGTGRSEADSSNHRDDHLDLSDTLIARHLDARAHIADAQEMALLYRDGADFFGVLMGLAGLLGWHIHPDSISRLLS